MPRKIKIQAEFLGTGGGFRKFCEGKTDLNGASRPLTRPLFIYVNSTPEAKDIVNAQKKPVTNTIKIIHFVPERWLLIKTQKTLNNN